MQMSNISKWSHQIFVRIICELSWRFSYFVIEAVIKITFFSIQQALRKLFCFIGGLGTIDATLSILRLSRFHFLPVAFALANSRFPFRFNVFLSL